MHEVTKNKRNQRLTTKQKNAKNKAWYKEEADRLDAGYTAVNYGYGDVSEIKRMKVNYDLFNNILDLSDFEYVCKPFGAEAGELPASMVNRDISSGKIKAILGMEAKRPFPWRALATNPESTTRREQEEFKQVREFVINSIMQPIREQVEIEAQQQQQGRELNEQELQQIKQQIEEQVKARTPKEVKKYMHREHQDPAEAMSHQLLQYLTKKCDLKRKFNKMFKHGMLSAKEIMYIGILNGEPEAWNVNSMRFNCDKSPDTEFVEDGEWATCEYRMIPSEIVKYFGDELTDSQIDTIYESWSGGRKGYGEEDFFAIDEDENDYDDNKTIPVVHCVWKSLRKLGFLTYLDENDQEQMTIVDETYKLNTDMGDVDIEWEWIPEVYETWKIRTSDPIYVNMRPIPGQFKDLDNLYYCKLPYYGVVYDNMNSQETSLMDRLKVYQYYYNIIMYRLEIIFASDKGKKVLMNINSIPDSAGVNIKQWQYFMESTPYMWYDPNEEGGGYADANTVAKVIDLSLVSDIQKYIEVAEYLREQAGRSVGITDAVEGQIGPNEAVRNTQQNLIQTSHILEPYFELHNHAKKNILQALLETAKIAYSQSKPKKLTYILDDMSVQVLNLDMALLDNSTIGIFISDDSKAQETLDTLRQLSHAAMQNQKIELSDVASLIRQSSIIEAEEDLKAAEETRREHEISVQKEQGEQQRQILAQQDANDQKKHEREKELVVLKEEERRKTEVLKGAMVGASFNPDTDRDGDGENDFIEIAKHGLDVDIKKDKQQLDREKFEYQKEQDKVKNDFEEKKLKVAQAKTQKSN